VQFAALTSQLSTGGAVTVDATSATSGNVDAIAAGITKIAASGITGTFSVTAAQAATVGLGAKVAAAAVVTITDTLAGATVIENGVFQSANDVFNFSAGELNTADGAILFANAQVLSANQFKLFNAGTALTAGSAGEGRFIFNGVDGKLYWDLSGDTTATATAPPVITDGAGDDVLIATLTGISTIASTDIVIVA